MKRGKLKSFTLTEVMVVLALTGMVVTIAFYVWYNFESFGSNYRQETNRVNEWNALDFALRRDASLSVKIEKEGSGLRFWKADSLKGQYWQALPQVVIRSDSTQVDTFHLSSLTMQAAFRQGTYAFQLIPGDSLLPDTITYTLPLIARAKAD